mmetsp:Transcript_62799/g.125898  ORF Transcript_62799/g.125898 Transcript_62799/m.125898 type:complete len:345 (-) Transcript_62799:128-1162(-)
MNRNEEKEEGAQELAISCHLYRQGPTVRLENELRELTGTNLIDESPLDPLQLNTIDSMHYLGQTSSEAMVQQAVEINLAMPRTALSAPSALPVLSFLDLGSGFGGCARFVATHAGKVSLGSGSVHVTALELQDNISSAASMLTKRSGLLKDDGVPSAASTGLAKPLAAEVQHVVGDICDPGLVLPLHGRYSAVYSKLTVLHIPFKERPKAWQNLRRAVAPGGLLHLEDYFEAEPLDAAESELLESKVGCPCPLPSKADYVAQLEQAGFTEVSFTDMSSEWGEFVRGRTSAYRRDRERHERVHRGSLGIVDTMQDFYDTTNSLFSGGHLGGAIITARNPLSAEMI